MSGNAQRDAGSQRDKAGDEDFFIRLIVEQGPAFFDGKKHGTTRELAELYGHYAKQSDGVLRELFSMFAKHLQAVLEVPGYQQNATGGYPNSAQWSPCGWCTLANGHQGRYLTISVNSLTSRDCYPCSPSGVSSG
jgi:hypothetical protein